MAIKQKADKNLYEGIEYESKEELLVLQWLLELQEEGFVHSIERAESFLLSSGLTNTWIEQQQLKTRVKEVVKKQVMLNGHLYTPEFKVIWDSKALDRIISVLSVDLGREKIQSALYARFEGAMEDIVTYLEVKPAFDQNNMTRLFKLNQKWVYDSYGVFVNLLEPYSLFEKTFTPVAALKTPTGKERKVNWEVHSLNEYLNEKDD